MIVRYLQEGAMPKQDLYAAIVVTLMFLVGVVLAIAKVMRRQRKIAAKHFHKLCAFRSNQRHRKAA
jgi:hypothetical protein